MAVYVSQASCDERGRYVGGQAGNQSGTELNTRGYYSSPSNPWRAYRAGTAASARAVAVAALAAVANMLIGYDQGERNTIRPLAIAAGFAMSAIERACECDCTSLAAVCAEAGGCPDSVLFAGGNLMWTGDAHEKLTRAGMRYMGKGLAESELRLGDILVRDGHCVIVTTAPEQGGTGAASTAAAGGTIEELAEAVIAGRIPVNPARREILGDRYDAVQAVVNLKLDGTPSAAGTSTGSPRLVAGTYKVICSALNVRSRPSKSAERVACYDKGQAIYSINPETVTADGYVWASYTARSGATRYVAIGTADGSEKYLAKA